MLIIACLAIVSGIIAFTNNPKTRPGLRPFFGPIKRGLDLAGGMRVVLQARPDGGKPVDRGALDAAVMTVERRVNSLGVSETVVQPKPSEGQIIVEIPEITDKARALELLQKTGALEFYYLKDVKSERNPLARWTMNEVDDVYSFTDIQHPASKPVTDPKDIKSLVIGEDVKPLLSGKDLVPGGAKVQMGGMGADVGIVLSFKDDAQRKFRDFTSVHIKEFVAITLDGVVLTAPVIREAIPGNPHISGNFTVESAQRTADLINAGALPVPLDIVQTESVEATLGQESVNQSLLAGMIGLSLVLLFMLFYYRLPGLIANVALVLYAIFTFAAFKLIGVTLTLPGLTGFILSIGMAVDANILIFERLKEELRSGKTLRAAVDAGFNRAFTSIFDSNMCTVITCLILYIYGTGPVKGFAVTLGVGVMISMFTAITVTRTILHLLVGAEWAQTETAGRRLFGLKDSWFVRSGRHFDIIGKKYYFFLFSILVILPGMIFWFMGGLKKGIEFTSGSSMTVKFEQPVVSDKIVAAMRAIGYPGSQAQISDRRTAFIRMKELHVAGKPTQLAKTAKQNTAEQNRIKAELTDRVGKFEFQGFSEVGPIISRELTTKAIKAVIMASLAIILYLSFRFAIGGFLTGLKFGICAVIALIHDVLVVLGASAIFGHFMGWEIDSLFVTAILTIIGFSVHDTIVVFDRIRENLKHRIRGESFDELANRSILQTFARSVNTSLTVVLTLVALLVFGGPVIRHFVAALLVGIISGTYSSIFNATPLVVIWEGLANKGGAKKVTEGRALVSGDRVRDLRPVSEQGTSEGASDTEAADKAKAKPKKKKRRY